MSDFLRHPILSRIAFFGDNSSSRTSATVGAVRRAQFAATGGKDPKDKLSDEIAETDIHDTETRLERAHGDAIVDEMLYEKGANIRSDPLAALRILDGKKVSDTMLRGSGRNAQSPYLEDGTNNPQYRRQANWLQGWDDMVATPVMRTVLDTGLLQAQLTTYDDAIHFARTRQFLQGGFYTSSHLETALKVIGSAKTDLRVGFYQLEHGAIAQGILDAASRNVRADVRLSSPHNTVGRALSELFGRAATTEGSSLNLSIARASGVDATSGSPINSLDDHFKFIAANLDTVKPYWKNRLDDENLMDRMVWISSANATLGAMGYGRKRPGQGMRGGRNTEGTFLLSFDLVQNGFFGNDETRAREIFYSLTEQAKNASIWMMQENVQGRGIGRNFGAGISGLSSPVQSRILETQGLASLYNSIISDLTVGALSGNMRGVKAYIANYGFGTEFVDTLFNLLAAGGEVNLLRHPRKEGMATEAIRSLRTRMASAGIDQSLLVDTLAHGEEFIHMKTSMFEFTDLQGNRRYHQIIGSQNLSNRHFTGYELGRGGVTTRDLSIFLHGEEAVGNRDAASLMVLQFRASQLFRERSDRFRLMSDAGWDKYQLYGLKDDVNIKKLWTAGASEIATRMPHQEAALALNGVRLKVGGEVSVGIGDDRVSIDLKDLVQLTVKDYGSMGPTGTLFVQELSKFIGPSYGIRRFEREEGISQEPYSLEQLYGIREYTAQETLLAAVGAAQEEYKSYMQTLGAAIGGRRLQLELMDPVNKGKIRQAMRISVRQSMEHFAGVEPGVSAYGAKQFTRLGFLQKRIERSGNNHWILDINNIAKLDAYAVEKSLTGQYDPDLMYRLGGRQMFFTAGSLSSFSGTGNTPPRFYDMQLFRQLPMSAIVRRKNENGEESDQNEFMFLLPQDKLMQLPQRLQNIMSARNLTLLEDTSLTKELSSNISDLVGVSRLAGEKGEAVRGIKFRGFAVPGLGGDNAYLIGEAFENAYFGDENYRRQAKLPIATTVEASLAMMADKIRDLVTDGVMDRVSGQTLRAAQLTDGRVYFSPELLNVLGHRLPTGLVEAGSYGANRVHYVNLNTDRTPGSGLIINANDLIAEREQSRGLFTVTIHGTTVRRLTSGDRSIIAGKFPYAFVQRGSKAVQTITQHASRGLFSGSNDDVNVIFGEKILKTGQAFIETGAELLASEDFFRTLNTNESQILSEKNLRGLVQFAGLFDKFLPYMTQEERASIDPLMQDFKMLRERNYVHVLGFRHNLMQVLDRAAEQVQKGPLRFGVHHEAIAGSMLAFGLHAYWSHLKNQGKAEVLNEAFTTSDRSFPTRGVDFSQMTVQQILGATYMTMVSAPSAAAVAMSSRNTVNFLHYHSDFYTDSFMDLMATSRSVRKRMAAYRELVTGGLLGATGGSEMVFTATEFNPMSRYQPGFAREFQRVLEITRELQGYGTQDTLTPEEVADPVQRIRNLRAEYRRIKDSVHAVLMGKASPISQQGNVLEQTFTGSALREDYRGAMARTYGPGSVGSVQANSVTEFLEIQQRAGVGARVLFVPQLGNVDASTGVFVQDPRGTRVRHVEVRFNSPGALLGIGSYDDFAHQMQKLQYDIETRLYAASFIQDVGGKAVSMMDEQVYRDYVELQEKIGELGVVQGMAAVSDMQKMFGGRVSVTGKNMIIGTLPEIPHGTMVLGQEAWNFMREGAAKEITEGLVALTSRQMRSLPGRGEGSFSKRIYENIEAMLAHLRSQGIQTASMQDLRRAAIDANLSATSPDQAEDLRRVEAEITSVRQQIDTWHQDRRTLNSNIRDLTSQIRGLKSARKEFFRGDQGHKNPALRAARRTQLLEQIAGLEARFPGEYSKLSDSLNARFETIENLNTGLTERVNKKNEFFKRKSELKKRRRQLISERNAFFETYHAKLGFYGEEIPYHEHAVINPEGFGIAEAWEVADNWSNLSELNSDARRLVERKNSLYGFSYRNSLNGKRGKIKGSVTVELDRIRKQLDVMQKEELLLYGRGFKLSPNDPRIITGEEPVGRFIKTVQGSEDVAISRGLLARRAEYDVIRNVITEQIDNLYERRRTLHAERDALYGVALDPNDPRVLTGEMDRTIGSKDRELMVLNRQLESLREQKLKLSASDASVTRVVELMMESLLDTSPHARDYLMSGLFQRSGAPPGPMGLVVGKILTIQEYNDIIKRKGGALMIHETLSARSVFLSSGSMAYNLGDFDGDTGSITWLQQFSRLKALDAIYKSNKASGISTPDLLAPGERLLMERVENNLNISEEEHQAHFARFYTGLTEIFDPANLFFLNDSQRLSNREARAYTNIDQMKSYFYGLEERVRTYASRTSVAYDIATRRPISIKPEEVDLTRVSAMDLGMRNDELKDLIAFRERKKTFFGLATAANEYAAQIFEMQDETFKYVSENAYRFRRQPGVYAEQAAFEEFVRTRGGEVFLSKMVSAAEKLAGSGIAGGNQSGTPGQVGDRQLSSEALMTYFLSTAYAATTIVSKVFEIGFSMSSVAEDSRARGFRTLRDRVESVGEIREKTQNLSMTEFRAFIEKESRLANEVGGDSRPMATTYREFGRELSRIDQTHANIAGVVLTINQIAREAIKPRGGDPLDEIFRFTDNMNAANVGDRRNYIYGAQQLAQSMPRYQGINALMQIIHGRDLTGKSVNISRDWKAGEGGEWDIAHRSLTNMLVDYYAGQVNTMYGMAASRQDQVNMLIRGEAGSGLALFQTAEQAQAFLDESVDPNRVAEQTAAREAAVRMSRFVVSNRTDRQRLEGYVGENGQISDLDRAFEDVVTTQAREMLRGRGEKVNDTTVIDAATRAEAQKIALEKGRLFGRIEQVADQRGMDYIWFGLQASKEKELRTEYMVGLESGDSVKFAYASARLSRTEKVKVLANSTSRGAFSSESGMRMIFEDIFSEFGSERELRRAAEETYTSDMYVDNLVEVYKQYRETGNVLSSFERMRANAHRTVEGTRLALTDALNQYNTLIGAATHDTSTGLASESYLNVVSESQLAANTAMQARARTSAAVAARQAAVNAQVEYEKAVTLQEKNETWMNQFEVGLNQFAEEGFIPTARGTARAESIRNSFATAVEAYDARVRKGGLISSVSSNILVPLAMSRLAGITMGAAGGFVGASAGDSLMGEAAEFTQMAIQYASPLNAIRESVRQSAPGMEGLVHVGSVGLSMVAGAYAGERVSRNIAEAYTAAGINRVGGGIAAMTMAASSIVGFGAGMAAMIAIEGLAAKFGFLQKPNRNIYADLVDAGSQFAYNDEQASSEMDELAGVQDESIAYADANGETNVTGSFYVYASAARDDDAYDTASSMDADIGTYVSSMSYDASGGGIRDTVTADDLDQVSGTRA